MKRTLFALALAGCYSPEARDCTVSCSTPKDCIGGQLCGADHFCAAPGVAGHCSAVDASVQSDAPPDVAEQDVMLTISIGGGGGSASVTVEGLTTCAMNMCMVHIPAHTMQTLTAIAGTADKPFQMWMDGCSGPQSTCTIAPSADLRVGAKFE